MHCPQCNHENPEHAKFCLECGTRLARACPVCGTELPTQAKFCLECGAQVGVRPAAAPAAAPDTVAERLQRLVPKEFAQRLLATRGQVAKERRVVTMLFSDVKGSTAMAEHLDPEDWAEIMDGAFEFLIAPIYYYEGTLARLMGDAILAFFGAPIAHEDDPERACRAALEITTEARRYAESLKRERGIEGFHVRVGIHTGLVVVGEAGSDLRVEYTAMGDAVNLAARMESAAAPGTVLITEETHKLIAPLFGTEALGTVEVKGRTQPVSTYRVLAAKGVPGKVRGIAGLESPLVGREAEFAALQEAVQRLRDGVGGLVTLVGEAGIGKSRLVAEVRNLPHVIASPYSGEAIPEKEGGDCFPVGPPLSLDKDERPSPGANGGEKMPRHRQTDGEIFDNDKPVAWVEGRCLSYGHSVAYLLWLDVLRALLGVSLEDAPPAVLERLQERVQAACPDRFDDVYPYVARLVSLPLEDDLAAKLDDMDGQDLKAHTFQAVQTLIECAANQQPLVLVCEDLHWADPTSIELLEQVLPLTERAPLLLLCVFRPVKDHRCWRFRELAAQAHAERHTDLLLEALSAAESETLVANLLRIEDLPEVLRERILSRAEGNPFYVEEVVRSLIDRGAIVQDPDTGRWTATREVADIPIPDTLQGVLMARIDRLQEEVKRVLQMASVIGRIFLYRVLEAIAEEKRRLDEHLLTLKYQEMIRERARIPELEYIFKHDLTREAAYNGLLKKARRVFHRQVAEALERLFPERIEEQLGLLAYHWEQARDAEKAAHYLERAGDQARLLYSHDEAIDYYERALVFLKAQDEHEHAARTLMKLGLTHHSAFDFNSSRLAHEQAFALFQRAAAQEPATPPAPAPHALRIGGLGQPDSLDPGTCVYGDVSAALFSGLLEWAPDWTIVPGVAASWEVLEGGRKYVFHLRHDVRWSDGRKVTAHDFAYAWKRVLDSGTGAPYASLLYDVKGAKPFHQGQVPDGGQVGIWATDDATLVVELEGPCGYFLHLMAYFVTRPVPRHVVQAHGPGWADPSRIVTNGPFCLERWKQEESLHLVRNPAYHDRFRGNVERIEMSLASEWDNQLHLYEGDELDILDTTFFRPGEELNAARRRHAGQSVTGPSMAVMCYAFDVSRPPLHDPRVRRALVMAVDREATLDTLSPGAFAPPAGGLVPPGVPGHSPGIAVPYDPEQARRLLAEAGYPGGRGFRALHGIAGGSTIVLCELWQTAWRGILGIEIEWEVPTERFDGPGYRAGADMFPAHWRAAYPDPDSFLRAGIYRERTHWRHEAYDRLVEQARRLTDQSERMRLYRQADQILTEEAPIVPVAYGAWHWLVKPWVRNAVRGWKDIIIEPH